MSMPLFTKPFTTSAPDRSGWHVIPARTRWLALIGSLSIGLMQLRVATVAGYDLPLAAILLVLFSVALFGTTTIVTSVTTAFATVTGVTLLKWALGDPTHVGLVTDYRSALLMTLSVSFVLIAARSRVSEGAAQSLTLIFRLVLWLVAVTAIVQSIAANWFGNTSALAPLGGGIIYGSASIGRFADSQGFRVPATFIEPSFAALVVFVSLSILSLRRVSLLDLAAAVLAFVCIRSFIGYAAAVSLVGYYVFVSRSAVWRTPVVALAAVIILGFVLSVGGIGRLNELSVSGTSGFYRVQASLAAVEAALTAFPAGIPWGSAEQFMGRLGYYNGGRVGTSLDNGVAVLIVYFGILVAIVAIPILLAVYRRLGAWLLLHSLLSLFWMLQFTGGLFQFDFCLLACAYVYMLRASTKDVFINNGPYPTSLTKARYVAPGRLTRFSR